MVYSKSLEFQKITEEVSIRYAEISSAKAQIKAHEKLLKGHEGTEELLEIGKELSDRITTWEENLIQPKQETFQDVINFNNQLNSQLLNLSGYIDQADPKITQGAKDRLKDLLADWKVYKDEQSTIINKEMDAYNKAYEALNLPAIILDKN